MDIYTSPSNDIYQIVCLNNIHGSPKSVSFVYYTENSSGTSSTINYVWEYDSNLVGSISTCRSLYMRSQTEIYFFISELGLYNTMGKISVEASAVMNVENI